MFVGFSTRTHESYGFPSSLCCLLVHRAGNTESGHLFGLVGIGVEDKARRLERFSCIRILHEVNGLEEKTERKKER